MQVIQNNYMYLHQNQEKNVINDKVSVLFRDLKTPDLKKMEKEKTRNGKDTRIYCES